MERSERPIHSTLYAPANRPRLIATIQSVQEHMGRLLRLRVTMAAEHDRSHEEHVKILEACERRNVKEAVRELRRHIEQTQREVPHHPVVGHYFNEWQLHQRLDL